MKKLSKTHSSYKKFEKLCEYARELGISIKCPKYSGGLYFTDKKYPGREYYLERKEDGNRYYDCDSFPLDSLDSSDSKYRVVIESKSIGKWNTNYIHTQKLKAINYRDWQDLMDIVEWLKYNGFDFGTAYDNEEIRMFYYQTHSSEYKKMDLVIKEDSWLIINDNEVINIPDSEFRQSVDVEKLIK